MSIAKILKQYFRTNRRETLSGKFKLTNGDNRGSFNIRYERFPESLLPDFLKFINFNTTLSVLHTDYNNFAIIWTCRNLGQYGHAESSWLMTRGTNSKDSLTKTDSTKKLFQIKNHQKKSSSLPTVFSTNWD